MKPKHLPELIAVFSTLAVIWIYTTALEQGNVWIALPMSACMLIAPVVMVIITSTD